jgi:hypothetical protein
MIASPDIAVEGNDVNVVWDDSRDGDKFHPEIYFINSPDGGITWNPNLRLTYDLTGASEWPRISSVDNTNHIAWFDDREGNFEIYYKRYPNFPASANLTLSHGWNLISFPVEEPAVNATPITNASSLCDATGCTNTAKWNATNQNYTNYIAGFDDAGGPNDFSIGEDDGVWLWWNGTQNGTFSITGYEPGPRSVHLLPGWNVIAYKSATPGDVEASWASQVQSGLYDDICYWDGQTFRHYIFPTTEMALIPTRGYFVWSDIDTYLSY